jgi:GDP-4-dehydro-6-deoxy-D-mannose reductase
MEHLAGQRIWVTGAGGFVGAHLLPRLAEAGAEVTPTDKDLDVSDSAAVAATVRRIRPDAIVHLAARSSVAASLEDARGVYEVNFVGARAVLAAAEAHSPKARVLLVGSSEVYGTAAPDALPFDESAPLRPRSPYAWTKACADLLGASYAARGLDVVRVRPFSHTGPGQSDTFVAASFAHQLAEMEAGRREPVLRVGNLESVRDFLDVDDVVAAYLALLDPAVPAGVYNVASGDGRTVQEILEMLLENISVRPRVDVDPARFRPTDRAVGDAGRLREATGWTPTRQLSRTLRALLDHSAVGSR